MMTDAGLLLADLALKIVLDVGDFVFGTIEKIRERIKR